MAYDKDNALLDVTGAYINRKFNEQSWYQENANTITTIVGFLATVLAWAAAQPFALDPRWEIGITLAGFLLTVFGVKNTRNGFSKSQVAKIGQAQADFVDTQKLVVPAEGKHRVPEDPADALAYEVAEYNASRE